MGGAPAVAGRLSYDFIDVRYTNSRKQVMMLHRIILATVILAVALHFANAIAATVNMKIESTPFGTTTEGHEVIRYTLTNSHGSSVSVMNWGASLLDVNVPDRDGNWRTST